MALRERYKSAKGKIREVFGRSPVQSADALLEVPQTIARNSPSLSIRSTPSPRPLPSAKPLPRLLPSDLPPPRDPNIRLRPHDRPPPRNNPPRLLSGNPPPASQRPTPNDRLAPRTGSAPRIGSPPSTSPSPRPLPSNQSPPSRRNPPITRPPQDHSLPQGPRLASNARLAPGARPGLRIKPAPPNTRPAPNASLPPSNRPTPSTRPSSSNRRGPNTKPGLGSVPLPKSFVTPALPPSPTPAPPGLWPTSAKGTWVGLKRFQQVLSRGSTVLGPLKLVMDDLARCIATHEDAAAARRDYQALKTELEALFNTLGTHFAGNVPPTMTASMDNLCGAIENELNRIVIKEKRGTGKRHWEAKKDLGEVMECYRRIQGHLGRLSLNADLSTWKIIDEQATEARLHKLKPSMSASYNSREAAQVRRRECTPNTRTEVLLELSGWRHNHRQGNIYWLNGMAGTGKTTIATSLCKMLEQTHELGASFFCTRQLPECRNVSLILPTIAYQLACFSRPFRCALSQVLERDPNIHTKSFRIQLEGMIVRPLRKVAESLPTTLVVVIDALDECDDNDGVGEILELLLKHALYLPMKVFVSSRPEPQIRQRFGRVKSQLVLHELDEKIVKGDIEIYLRTELTDISISKSQLANLVERAGVLFIYAATVARYIKAKNFHSGQQERLNHVLSALPTTSSNKNKEIDALYSVVLASAFSSPDLDDSDKDRMRLVLHTVVCAQEPFTVSSLTGLLQMEDGSWVREALDPLWSVLHVSESGANSLVTTLHASFPDYMLDPRRSTEYSCNAKAHHGQIAELCFERIRSNKRQFNICRLGSSYVFDEQVPDLKDRVKRTISSDLAYACQYWVVHLELGGPSNKRMHLLERFLSAHLLFWMEVMNLRKRMSTGSALLAKARQWCMSQNGALNIKDLVHDAWRFVIIFAANPVSRSTPHIYVSMLASWPSSRPISERYVQHTNHLIRLTGTAMGRRELALLDVIATRVHVDSAAFSPDCRHIVCGSAGNAIRVLDAQTGQMVLGPLLGHTYKVNSVAFSTDGMHIVSGSEDQSIRVWDAQSGETVLGPLKAHTDYVWSVAFSPDSTRIVSGSADKTIRVWDVQTGQMVLGPLKGHTDSIYSVAFSSNGLRIVSSSEDKTIWVWDARNGRAALGPLKGHTDAVLSSIFSPNCTRIASGSRDGTVQVWDAQTGNMLLGPLEGHTHLVNSVAYSPDGMHIASASGDNTICVWDAQNGELLLGPLLGHTSLVYTAVFSPDGMHIVSGSADNTIHVWDPQSRQEALESGEGHTSSVLSVAFSPDGSHIVSSSVDETIQIWDAQTRRRVLEPLKGHTSWVRSVAFSPGGTRIVSGSNDETVRVWDVKSGCLVLGPLRGHSGPVSSVAFSPNGRQIVSGSEDTTIRVWDAQSGQLVLEPLEGHTVSVTAVVFVPNSLQIVSSSGDGTIQVWASQTGRKVLRLKERNGMGCSVALSPDGIHIVSVTSSKSWHPTSTITVWL